VAEAVPGRKAEVLTETEIAAGGPAGGAFTTGRNDVTDRLKGKVAIVVGAGSSKGGLSIGMATAVVFAREGAKVFAVDVGMDHLAETKQRIEEIGGEVALHVCDVGDGPAVDKMVEACIARFGRVDILFNNVGIQAVGGPLELSEENFDRLMRVNVKGMFFTCRAVLPHMIAQGGGAIVNNASVGALRYSYPAVGYMASKGAVLSLTTGVGLQHAAQGVRANAVVPGYITSERMTARFKQELGDNWMDEVRKREKNVPSGKLGEPWDIAHAVLFLASDEAKYVNGTMLVVDGGLSMTTTGRA